MPNARNARPHGTSQPAFVAASIREFGFIDPAMMDRESDQPRTGNQGLSPRGLPCAEAPGSPPAPGSRLHQLGPRGYPAEALALEAVRVAFANGPP